jgi:integrase
VKGEWSLVRAIADGLEHLYGWDTPAAQRLRFLLDFAYATGLRAELVGATLGGIQTDPHGDHWLHLVRREQRLDASYVFPGLSILWRNGITNLRLLDGR